MMRSEIKIDVPDQIDENTSFTEIMGGVLLDYKDSNIPSFSHAALLPYAVRFFRERTPEDKSPISILEASLQGTGPLIPGCSVLSIPYFDFMNFRFKTDEEKMELFKMDYPRNRNLPTFHDVKERNIFHKIPELYKAELEESLMMRELFKQRFFITNGEKDEEDNKIGINLSHASYSRGFSQVLTGCLEASIERGQEDVLRIPSFANREPNYFNEVRLNYFGEGIKRGFLIKEDSVGNCLGKHSEGGTIIVKGSSGFDTGSCSKNTTFYIGGDVQEIDQDWKSDFYIKDGLWGLINGKKAKIELGTFWIPMDSQEPNPIKMRERLEPKMVEREIKISEFNDGLNENFEEFVKQQTGVEI